MDKVATAVFQEIISQPQYEKVAMCLYQDIQLRTAEKLASLSEMEKIAYNEALYGGGYAKNMYSNVKGPSLVDRMKNMGNSVMQRAKNVSSAVGNAVKNPSKLKGAFYTTMAGISPSDMENFMLSNTALSGHPLMSTISTGIDAFNFINKFRHNYSNWG